FPEMPQTKTFYEIQYYKIEHCDPAAVMGYILALESVAANDLKWLNEKLTALYGKECAKLIQVHADDDPDHVEKALQLINGLHESRLSEININIEQTAHCYNNILDACQARAGGKIKKAA
ncbi:MAG: hypothetical protein H7336_08465, partial [Bacteriovorax sp.]|nr:hypothetical protein [Bacteriovorax sp.]